MTLPNVQLVGAKDFRYEFFHQLHNHLIFKFQKALSTRVNIFHIFPECVKITPLSAVGFETDRAIDYAMTRSERKIGQARCSDKSNAWTS